MASDSSLKTWVSDKLMSLLGYSQPTVVQYVIGLSESNVLFHLPYKYCIVTLAAIVVRFVCVF